MRHDAKIKWFKWVNSQLRLQFVHFHRSSAIVGKNHDQVCYRKEIHSIVNKLCRGCTKPPSFCHTALSLGCIGMELFCQTAIYHLNPRRHLEVPKNLYKTATSYHTDMEEVHFQYHCYILCETKPLQ